MNADTRSKSLSDSYMSWLRSQYQFIGEQIHALETQMQDSKSGSASGSGESSDADSTPDQATDDSGGGG